jgi:Putative MetA-pathway of phenol degradation
MGEGASNTMTWILRIIRSGSSTLRALLPLTTFCAFLFPTAVPAQDAAGRMADTTAPARSTAQAESPEANPGRPTVSTPATLTPVGYLQFETGILAAWHSPEFSSQTSPGEVTKYAIVPRIQLLVSTNPYAHSDTEPNNGTGDTLLGVQGVVHPGQGARPTFALSYFGRVYSGNAPNLDVGSASQSAILLASADVWGFHYDTNYLFNEAVGSDDARRVQFGQTLSVSHPLSERFGLSGEIWHFTQPFLRGEAVGNLWAVNYNARRNLVLDAALNRGLTSTSTRWELLAGFTYLLPRRIDLRGRR